MATATRSSVWRRARRWFRWCRVCFWLFLLTLVLGLLYLNRVGLPDFLKTRLQTELRAHGADFQFQRLRWHGYRGLVAETATLASSRQADGPRLALDELALDLDWALLLRDRRLSVGSIDILHGAFAVPLNATNQPTESLELHDLNARLRFLPGDVWELEELSASFLGATIHIGGTVTNASLLRSWSERHSATAGPAGPFFWREPLRQFLRACRQLQFSAPPEFRLRFHGDAREPASFAGTLRCRAVGARSRWVRLEDAQLELELSPAASDPIAWHGRLRLAVKQAEAAWGELRQLDLNTLFDATATNPVPATLKWSVTAAAARVRGLTFNFLQGQGASHHLTNTPGRWLTDLTLSAHEAKSDWGTSRANLLDASFTHSLTNLSQPIEAQASFDVQQLDSRWGTARQAKLAARVGSAPSGAAPAPAAWQWWTNLAPYRFNLAASVRDLRAGQLNVEDLSAEAVWQAPELVVTNLVARLSEGSLQATQTVLNIETREARTALRSEFDVHRLAPWLGSSAAQWLDQFTWTRPPLAEGTVRGRLPPWTNTSPDWRREVMPTLTVTATVSGQDVAHRGVPISAAALQLSLANEVLRFTNFTVTRPEGQADLDYELETATEKFRWRVKGALAAHAVAPFIDREAPRWLESFVFNSPVAVAGEVWGCWKPPKQVACALNLGASNFVFRGEPVDQFTASLSLADRFLTVTGLQLKSGEERVEAQAVGVNLDTPEIFLTNVQCRIDPLRVARVIGTNVVETLRPYRFDTPPFARVQGRLALRPKTTDPDLAFELAGGPFHYWRLHSSEVAAVVHWQSNRVAVTNISASFHQGRLAGELHVDLPAGGPTDLRFRGQVANANLHSLLTDLSAQTNRLEGFVSATFNITRADPADDKTWTGNGQAEMRDGLLWDLPIFGVFSPVLNALLPGLGNSRARSARAIFTIEKGQVHTDDLVIEAGPARLRYKGNVDWTGKVAARVEAELLASTPLVGSFISLALLPLSKVLVYKVAGTLSEPQLEPLYVPKLFQPLLRPFHTLKSFFPSESPGPAQPNEPPRNGAP
jgi:hypothetical protein